MIFPRILVELSLAEDEAVIGCQKITKENIVKRSQRNRMSSTKSTRAPIGRRPM